MIGWIMRRAPWVIAASLLVTLVSGYFSMLLYRNLRTELEELLPTKARSVQDLGAIHGRMESTQTLVVLVFSEHPDASKRFVTDLARAAEHELGGLISRVEYRIDREIRFYKKRQALMMSLPDLIKVRDYVRDRISYESDLRNPLTIFSGENLVPPKLDEKELLGKYTGRLTDYAKFKDGYYAMNDGKIRAVLIYASSGALSVDEALKLREKTEQLIGRLGPGSYAPDLKVEFTGDVANLVEERNSLISDLETSTIIVAALVMLALSLYYRDLPCTLALIASLLAGTLWTFGVAYFLTGYLNANSAFLGSIVIGNGINFGVVFLARYLEERRERPHEQALPVAVRGAIPGTLTAALAAAASYGSLSLTSFRGFRQFGVIGLVGMVLCWVSAFTLLPALLTVADRFRARRRAGKEGHAPGPERRAFARGIAWLVGRFPRGVLAATAAVTLVLGILAARHRGSFLETDTSRLRDRGSLEHGSAYYSRYLDEMFGRYISPLVILPRSREHAKEIGARLSALRDSDGPSSLIASVYTVDDFVAKDQRRKVELLREIRGYLTPAVIRRLSPRDARLARDFLTPESFRPFGIQDLPPLVLARFRERDGSVGKLVLVEPVFSPAVLYQFKNQHKLIEQVRSAADAVEPGAPVAGQLPVTVDMISSILVDGPRATLFAFLAVVLLTVVLFRNLSMILRAQVALLLGVGWMLCAALALDLKINFLNFIALPITFGIGVDYGVNILARIRSEGDHRVQRIVRTTGSAVSLASLTTIIGYSSLLIAGNQGFVSFGRLAVLGEVTCLTAAMLVLPAFVLWRAGRSRPEAALPVDRPENARRAA